MPRFYVDVHADSLSEWDDDGEILRSVDDAVVLAREKARDTLISNARVGADQHAVAVIRDATDSQVATVTVGAEGEPKVAWAPSASSRTPN